MEYKFWSLKTCYVRSRRWLFLLGVLGANFLLFQFMLLPYGNVPLHAKISFPSLHDSSTRYSAIGKPLKVHALDLTNVSGFIDDEGKYGHIPVVGFVNRHSYEIRRMKIDKKSDLVFEKNNPTVDVKLGADRNAVRGLPEKKIVDTSGSSDMKSVHPKKNILPMFANKSKNTFSVKQSLATKSGISTNYEVVENKDMDSREPNRVLVGFKSPLDSIGKSALLTNPTPLESLGLKENSSTGSSKQQNNSIASDDGAAAKSNPIRKWKMRCEMPPKSRTLIQEMNHILVRRRASSRAMKPRWPSKLDQEIVAARSEIEHAPIVTNDRELYAPLFRNVSMFKRSYELMERVLKIYVYKDGDKPIFHQPILRGLYASEGWFMKLMEGNKHFVVKDPAKAHLFYVPFSSRMLEHSLYVRNSHNRTNLRQYMKDYTEKIAAKYHYFNRTGGSDHFLVACHDWAPYELRHHMEYCIKALCNADVTAGFKIGRDVSLPETYVRSARSPLKDLGGRPPHQRPILAFYAGNMHGYLRPIFVKHWKDKDPNMKISGPMPPGVASKMNYIYHMKSSKYCICPKGYNVNSPRVVEAIFYECVPVIISDNFVPPFFEILDWDAFSVILAEKDIPNLKDILHSIPEEKYLKLQLGVKRVQKHFLWHVHPLKHDLFHMILHSIWNNRVFQINVRRR